MTHAIFHKKKSVHVTLPKEVHMALRQKLLGHGLTMQDFFLEAAEMVLIDNKRADDMLLRTAKKKLEKTLIEKSRSQNLNMGEFDKDTLYNLIDDNRGQENVRRDEDDDSQG